MSETKTGAREYDVVVRPQDFVKAMESIKNGMVRGVGKTAGGHIVVEYASASSAVKCVMAIDMTNKKVHHFCHAVKVKNPCWHLAFALGFLGFRKQADFPQTVKIVLEEPKAVVIAEDLSPTVLGKPGEFERVKLRTTAAPAVSPPVKSGGTESKAEAPVAASPEDNDNAVDYMLSNGVSSELMEMVLKFRNNHKWAPELAARIKQGGKFLGDGKTLVKSIASVLLKKNVLFTGPKGTGKNVLIESLSWLFRLPLYEVLGNNQTEVAALTGDKTLVRDQHGRVAVDFEVGPLVEAMQAGGMLLIDEFNGIMAGLGLIFHGLDHRRRLDIPGYGVVDATETFRLVGAMNVGYNGTIDPNEATVDRMVVVNVGYTKSIADIVLAKSLNKDEVMALKMQRFWDELTESVARGEVSENAKSMRGIIDAADMMMPPFNITPFEALVDCVANKVFDDTERAVVMDHIGSLFSV